MSDNESYKPEVFDPTKNVLQLVEAAVKRLDDLREADTKHVKELMQVRADHANELREAESKRLNAIREVDVNAVAVATASANTQAAILAKQLTEMDAKVAARMALVEKAQYEAAGKIGGRRDTWAWIFGGIMALIALGSFILPRLK